MEWNNFLREKDAAGNEVIVPSMFVTYGKKHMKLWMLARDPKSGQEVYNTQMCRFGKVQVRIGHLCRVWPGLSHRHNDDCRTVVR